MSRVVITAPAMSDDDALRIIREFADMGFDVNAQGPCEAFDECPAADGLDPHDLPPAERKQWYESENLRLNIEREQRSAPQAGWHIAAIGPGEVD